ncbi:DUF2071 domain-containing protein [Streptomyces sp. NPDC052415]|uniref:DUF2071 domain-containing protein n=1 Tax=Streptomyces sp. NPDC052415 TaxID=3365690 RepID=UPI0037D0B4B5
MYWPKGPADPGGANEVNVRVYSRDEKGRRGVIFLSLDCDRLVPAVGGRAGFGLPYRWSRISRHWYGRRLVSRVQDRRPHRPGGLAWVDVSDEVITPVPLDRFLTQARQRALLTRRCGSVRPAWSLRCILAAGDVPAGDAEASQRPSRAESTGCRASQAPVPGEASGNSTADQGGVVPHEALGGVTGGAALSRRPSCGQR